MFESALLHHVFPPALLRMHRPLAHGPRMARREMEKEEAHRPPLPTHDGSRTVSLTLILTLSVR